LLDTKQDAADPSKRTNADLDFFAGLGGGTKVWSEKPLEAATRTITNLVPSVLGDEAVGTKPPEGPPPEGPPSGGDAPPSSNASPPAGGPPPETPPPSSSSEPPPSSEPVGPPNAYGPVDMKGDPWTPDNDPLLRTEPGPPEKDPMAKWKDPEQFKKWAEQRAAQRANQLMKENPGSLEQGRHGETDARAGAQLQRR